MGDADISGASGAFGSGGGSGGSGGSSSFDMNSYFSSLYDSEEDRKNSLLGLANESTEAWEPIFEELDRQLGSLPQRQEDYEGRVGSSADAQLSDVEAQRNASLGVLESEKAKGLRDLEGDVRNQLEAAGTKIGLAGAGSSSAVGQASEAIARVGQKARGNLQEQVISKITAVNNLASEQRSKVNQWKGDKLFEITSFFGDKIDEIRSQKATAQKDRKTALSEMEMGIEQEFINALRNLDGQVTNYAQTIDAWERDRVGSSKVPLADSLTVYDELSRRYGNEEQARQWMDAQGIYTLPQGIKGTQVQTPDALFGGGTSNIGAIAEDGSYNPDELFLDLGY